MKLIRTVIILFFTALSCQQVYSQKQDTAFQKNNQATVVVVDSLNELAFKAKRYNIARALNILFLSRTLASKINYKGGLAISLLYEGGIFQQKGFDKRALSIYYNSLDVSKAAKDTLNIARANQEIASLLKDSSTRDDAETMLQQALDIFKRNNKQQDVVNVKNTLGVFELEKNNYAQADEFFNQALADSRYNGYVFGEKKALYNKGLLSKALKRFKEADSLFSICLRLDNTEKDYYGMALSHIQLSDNFLKQKTYGASVMHALNAYSVADSIKANQLQQNASQALINIYKITNDVAGLARWQDSLIRLQRIQFEEEKDYAIDFIDILRDQELKSQATEQQKLDAEDVSRQQKILLIIIGVLFIAMTIMGVPVYISYRNAKRFGRELAQKNMIIEKNSASLDQLNRAISRQNQKLEEENRMKDKLLSIISHDLRHPLVNTKSILDLINLKLVSPAETESLLEQLESQYVRSLNLLDNLLFWIRGQMKGLKIDRTLININQLVNTVIEEQRMSVQNKHITVANMIDQPLELYAEKEMLRIIFRNLLINAVKFTPMQGSIFFNSVIKDRFVFITVKDNGIGMTDEVIRKINEQGYFTSKGTANEKGSGFGLMLVKDLVAKHNGELIIQSEPGKGSSFTIKLYYQTTK